MQLEVALTMPPLVPLPQCNIQLQGIDVTAEQLGSGRHVSIVKWVVLTLDS